MTVPSDAALEQAARWLARLNEGQDAAVRADFRRWLAADPAHAAAMDRMAGIWEQTGRRRVAARPSSPPAPVRRPFVAGLAALAACVLLLAVTPSDWLVWSRAGHATTRGETRLVHLADGSEVRLDADSAVEVAYGPLGRDVRLVRGEASFKVAKSRLRPFAVTADHLTVVATGTEFIVEDGPQTRVTLLEGGVELRDPGSGDVTGRLTPGQMALADGAHPPRIAAANVEQASSWRQGRLIFRQTSLADAVARFARYGGPRVTLSEGASALQVSGVFGTHDVEKFVTMAARLHGLAVTQGDDGGVTLTLARARRRG